MVSQIDSNLQFHGHMETRQGGRNENQDSCGFSDTPLGLLVVICDGMGGGPAGKTASLLATQKIIDYVKASTVGADRRKVLKDAVNAANAALLDAIVEDSSLQGMGTTVVALLIDNDSAVILHVGDSRLYKVRGKSYLFRTKDHSYVGDLVRKGQLTEEQARLSAQSNIITKALGISPNVEAEIDEVAFEKGDRFILCTDGIWGAYPEKQLIRKFSESNSIGAIVEKLAMETDELGKEKGAHHDNLTIAIIETKIDSLKNEKMTRFAKRIIFVLSMLLLASICVMAAIFNKLSYTSNLKAQNNEYRMTIEQLYKTIKDNDSIINALKSKSISEAVQASESVKIAQAEAEKAKAEAEKAKAEADIIQVEADKAKAEAQARTQKSVSENDLDLVREIIKDLNSILALNIKSEKEMKNRLKACESSLKDHTNKLIRQNNRVISVEIRNEIQEIVSKTKYMPSDKGYVITLQYANKIKNTIQKLENIK